VAGEGAGSSAGGDARVCATVRATVWASIWDAGVWVSVYGALSADGAGDEWVGDCELG
jgi:hypothetical protein